LLVTGYSSHADTDAFDRVEKLFLEGRYERAAAEAAGLIDAKSSRRDELYYLKGLSELKSNRTARARETFEALIEKYPQSKRALDARIAMGDSYFIEGDADRAVKAYNDVLERYAGGEHKTAVYYKLGTCYSSMGAKDKARDYFEKAKAASPLSFEARMAPDVGAVTVKAQEKPIVKANFTPAKASALPPKAAVKTESATGIVKPAAVETKKYFSVQVGSFNSRKNAERLNRKLSAKGYKSRMEIPIGGTDRMYRVKIGRFSSRPEAEAAAAALKEDGYKTKICEQ
jgi:cell division septation protein DedD